VIDVSNVFFSLYLFVSVPESLHPQVLRRLSSKPVYERTDAKVIFTCVSISILNDFQIYYEFLCILLASLHVRFPSSFLSTTPESNWVATSTSSTMDNVDNPVDSYTAPKYFEGQTTDSWPGPCFVLGPCVRTCPSKHSRPFQTYSLYLKPLEFFSYCDSS
jgi:hypothetical protein